MDSLDIPIVFASCANVLDTSFILGRQHRAEAQNQEGKQENDHDIEAGLPEGDMGGDEGALDEQGQAPLQLAQSMYRQEETTRIESPVASLETEKEQEEEPIGDVALRLDVQLPPVTMQETGSELHAKVMKFGSEIGMWATGISFAGIIALLTSDNRNQRTSLYHRLLLVASTLAMLASFILGGVLLILAYFHVEIFPPSDPKSIRKIKIIIGVTIGSVAIVVSFVTAVILQRAY